MPMDAQEREPIDLEVSLRPQGEGLFSVELIFTRPDSAAETRPLIHRPGVASFDLNALAQAWPDTASYGMALGKMLLHDPAIATAFAQARAVAASEQFRLRVRLALPYDAPELHALVWETLCDPNDGLLLAQSRSILFTRVLGTTDWRPITLRARSELRALVAVAAPDGLDTTYQLAPINRESEERRALASLGSLVTTLLSPRRATLDAIVAAVDGYDIFYLVAHGKIVDETPYLFLEDAAGKVARVKADDLVRALTDLERRPRLILLASCESAGAGAPGSSEALAGLGPRLADSGVPAVIAMQGALTQATNAAFAPAFFQALLRHGQIDEAIAAARWAVREQPDWWVPALFTRLRSGRIWYDPGFGAAFTRWPSILTSINNRRCTPILGPGLLESYVGTSRALARGLAQKYRFPLAPFARDDLPQVAQFLAVDQDPQTMIAELAAAFRQTLASRLKQGAVPLGGANDYISAAGRLRRADQPDEPYKLLAELPFEIYLTANPDNLLTDALREAGKKPQVQICRWYIDHNSAKPGREPRLNTPSEGEPLVFHLFGTLDKDQEASLVLTEDDYFHYMNRVAADAKIIPPVVQKALANSALLFLGFRLESWSFRVLFESLMRMPGAELRKRYTHVAVQLDPQDETLVNPAAARKYLMSRFGDKASEESRVSIYWGGPEDFIGELARRKKAADEAP